MKVNRALSAALLQAATEAAHQAGRLLLANVQKNRKVQLKGRIDLVTEMDLRSENLIVAHLRRAFPESSFLTEEGSVREEAAEVKWIVDPLDGTTNFAHNYPFFAVSVGVEVDGAMAAGAVYDPVRDELFAAAAGHGATLNGAPIRVSAVDALGDALLVTGFPYDVREHPERHLPAFTAFLLRAQGVRRDGSAALNLCYLAMGRFDGFWEHHLAPWDVGAGSLIVGEAGGLVTDLEGGPFRVDGRRILASNRRLHPAMIAVLAEARAAAGGPAA